MNTNGLSLLRSSALHELSDFLERQYDSGVGWPRLAQVHGEHAAPARESLRCSGLKVLVVGGLGLELHIQTPASKAQVAATLHDGCEGPEIPWEVSKAKIGGFVGHVLPAATELGARVSVCTVIPVPTPRRIREFLETHCEDTRFVTGLPGPAGVVTRIQCSDGELRLRRRGHTPGISVPARALEGADVVLADSEVLAPAGNAASDFLGKAETVWGLGRSRRRPSFRAPCLSDARRWTFLEERDARWLAGRMDRPDRIDADGQLWTALRDQLGAQKLVVQLGDRGAVLVNGSGCPYHVSTCPVGPEGDSGAGDTLLAVTTLASAAGADDRLSLRRGVAAATGLLAGLPLPSDFGELDAA